MKKAARKKLERVRERAYLVAAFIVSMMPFFWVKKGEDDIILVYDASKCGLNGATWIPHFWLPTINTLLRMVTSGTWMGDQDVEEMFHNFMLHMSLRPYCGVDLTLYFPEEAVGGGHTTN